MSSFISFLQQNADEFNHHHDSFVCLLIQKYTFHVSVLLPEFPIQWNHCYILVKAFLHWEIRHLA